MPCQTGLRRWPTGAPVNRKTLVYVAVLAGAMFSALPAFAGTCPPSVPSGITSCFFISSGSGVDTNAGTSEASPWAHLPGMVTCTNVCASTTPTAGEGFILKGGDTWANANFPVTWIWSGTSSNRIYIGVDPNWPSSSWARPVFDAGGTAMSGLNDFIVISRGQSYVTIDNLEMKGMYWTGNPAYGSTVMINVEASTYITIENSYFHAWTHDTAANGTFDVMKVILGDTTSPFNVGSIIDHCLFDGSPSGTDSGMAVYVMPTVTNSIAQNMSNGFLPNGTSTIAGDIIGPINPSFDSTDHENCLEPLDTIAYIYNNVIHDCDAVSILAPGAGSPGSFYIFNNVFYSSTKFPVPIEIDDYAPASNINAYIYNNTITVGTSNSGPCVSIVNRGNGAIGTMDARNNFCMSTGSFMATGPGARTLTNANNVTMTPAQASAAGMSTAETFAFQPPNSTCSGQSNCPIGSGIGQDLSSLATGNLASLASDTSYGCSVATGSVVSCPARSVVSRKAQISWGAGAYDVPAASGGPPPPPPAIVIATAH